jgi:hypothetical protein
LAFNGKRGIVAEVPQVSRIIIASHDEAANVTLVWLLPEVKNVQPSLNPYPVRESIEHGCPETHVRSCARGDTPKRCKVPKSTRKSSARRHMSGPCDMLVEEFGEITVMFEVKSEHQHNLYKPPLEVIRSCLQANVA